MILFWVIDRIAELPRDPNIGLLQSQKYQLDLLQPFVVGWSSRTQPGGFK